MDYDFRNYESQIPMYRHPTSSPSPANHPMYAPPPPPSSNMYPKVNPQTHAVIPPAGRVLSHHHHHHQNPPPQSSSSSSGLGIRVMIKPEYRITPPPQLLPQVVDIPRSNFQFDFELEKKILAEVEKGNPNWAKLGLENLPPRTLQSTPSVSVDPVVAKYISSGLNREAVTIALSQYGDNPTKVREFAVGYNILREMGFQPKNVAEALIMHDNDTDKALAHFLNGSS